MGLTHPGVTYPLLSLETSGLEVPRGVGRASCAHPALGTSAWPRAEFCSCRVQMWSLELCSKLKKALQIVLLLRVHPVLPRDMVLWISRESGLVKAWFKQSTSFLLYRRKGFEPGFPACGPCFCAGCPLMRDSTGMCAVTLQLLIGALHRVTVQGNSRT